MRSLQAFFADQNYCHAKVGPRLDSIFSFPTRNPEVKEAAHLRFLLMRAKF